MNVKVATEIIKFCGDICGHMDCKKARGFLEASKAAEPLLEVIKAMTEALEFYKARDEGRVENYPKGVVIPEANRILSSSAQVVENYRKEVLGE